MRLNRAKGIVALGLLLLLAIQYLPASAAAPTVPSQAATVILTIIPPRLPADGGVFPAAVVSLVDSANLPTEAEGNVTVFLTSDLTNIAAVPSSITIPAGQEYAVANITTTITPGSAMITASAQGLKSEAPSLVTTVTPSGYPSKLLVFTSPSTFLPGSGSGTLLVEVVDDAGLPSKAISPIPVQLSSSNSSIASLSQTNITVPAGSFIATGAFSTLNSGSAVITGTSSGYSTGTTLVTVDGPKACTGLCVPYKLGLRVVAGGSALPTDGLTYNVLEVSLQTSTGTPVTSASDTIIQLTSDQSGVASVQALVTIPAGSISYLAPITTSSLAGTANITAAAAGLVPTTAPINTVIPAPSKLQAYIAPPSSAFSNNGNLPILVVQLQDSNGNPARARQDTSVVITSSNSSLLTGSFTLEIPTGSDYVVSYLQTKGVGTSTLTASAQDLVSSQVELTSVPSPLVVNLLLTSTSSTYIYQNQTGVFEFKATFVGMPLQNVNVSWSTTGGTITPHVSNTGTSGVATATFTPGTYGAYNITARAYSPQTGNIDIVYSLTVAQVPVKAPPSIAQEIIGVWYYLVAAAAVVVVAGVYLFRMRRKKQMAEIEAGFEVV